jgi:hypothetical protein
VEGAAIVTVTVTKQKTVSRRFKGEEEAWIVDVAKYVFQYFAP